MASTASCDSDACYHLIGSEHSLFTGKARAYLLWKGVPFDEVAASMEVYMACILPRTGVAFVPVLASADWTDVVQDTSAIIDYIEARHPARPVIPRTPCRRIVSRLMETFADEWLVIAAMHYRWNFPEQQEYITMEFGKLTAPAAPAAEQMERATAILRPFKRALPTLGVSKTTVPAVEATLWTFLRHFDTHLRSHPYLLGANATLGDFALMGPLYAHLYRDPVPGALLKMRTPFVADWVDRLRGMHEAREQPHSVDDSGTPRRGQACTNGGGVGTPQQGRGRGYLPPPLKTCKYDVADTIPTTVLPMLAMALREQLPIVHATAAAVCKYRAEQYAGQEEHGDGQEVPRFLGKHEFTIGGVQGQRAILPFVLWMHQRAWDDYQALADAHRVEVDGLLEPLLPPPHKCAAKALALPAAARVGRVENKLVLASANKKAPAGVARSATSVTVSAGQVDDALIQARHPAWYAIHRAKL